MDTYKFSKTREARCLVVWEVVDQTGTPRLFMVADEATTGSHAKIEDMLNTDVFISQDYYTALKVWREMLVEKIFAELADLSKDVYLTKRFDECKMDVIKLLEELGA